MARRGTCGGPALAPAGCTDFAAGEGALHVLFPDWTVRTVLRGLTLPNGLGWSPDDRTFCPSDGVEHVLLASHLDPETATLYGLSLDLLCVTSARDGLDLDSDDRVPDGSVLCIAGTGARGTHSVPFGR